MSGVQRTALAVVLLQTDEEARRMVAMWPLVPRGLAGTALEVAWARACAIPPSAVRRRCEMLLRSSICREDGTVDPDAARVIEHLAAAALRSPRGRS